jgi:hypothetical protein
LSNVDSPVLSSPSVLSALQKASPSDVVQLSTAALQLENVDAMFGMPAAPSSSTTGLTSLLTSLEAPQIPTPLAANAEAPSLTSSTASPADQAASYQAALQQSEAQTLFGLGPTSASNSLLNILG